MLCNPFQKFESKWKSSPSFKMKINNILNHHQDRVKILIGHNQYVILRRERLAAWSESAMEENKKSTKFQHKGDEQKKWADFYASQFCLVKMQLVSSITLSEFHQDVRGWNERIECVFGRWAADVHAEVNEHHSHRKRVSKNWTHQHSTEHYDNIAGNHSL